MTNIKQNTEINGAIITDECSALLKVYQDDDNQYLKDQAMLIADAVCYISKTLMGTPLEKDEKKAIQIISNLAFLKEDILKLQKP